MKRRLRLVAVGLLVCLAVGLAVGIILLHGWGGRIETILMVYGDRVWVTIDVGQPRVFLLLLAPGAFLGAAFSLYTRRPGE